MNFLRKFTNLFKTGYSNEILSTYDKSIESIETARESDLICNEEYDNLIHSTTLFKDLYVGQNTKEAKERMLNLRNFLQSKFNEISNANK